MEKHKNWL